jgi:hypothetical protein
MGCIAVYKYTDKSSRNKQGSGISTSTCAHVTEHMYLDVGKRHGARGNPFIVFIGSTDYREEVAMGLVAARVET